MPLQPGDNLGPYRIVSVLGAGGMGEVYKARDTRLDRTVALKVLPPHIAKREDLRARFEREAKAVSSLNHPNVCALFDIGEHQGVAYMVMEYIEGGTLADRIAKGPIPLDQALKFAIQTASALDRAHRTGVVHRDIKPGNIMLTRDGVKVLDFGLAKSVPKAIAANDVTLTAAITSEGTILGTPHYMPPEQYEGKEADERSDIFSFGCVVYEMITGKRAFDGKSRASIIAAVLGADPPRMSAVQPVTPSWLEHVIGRCLRKDPEERWQSIRDVMFELHPPDQPPVPTAARSSGWLWPGLAAVGFLAAVAMGALWLWTPRPRPEAIQFTVDPPAGRRFGLLARVNGDVSPDGKMLAYITGGDDEPRQLWVRSFDSLEPRPLPNTEQAASPFWSPDSKSIAYFSGSQLKRIDLATGTISLLCDLDTAGSLGGAWSKQGVILFGSRNGIVRVPAAGGIPAPATDSGAGRVEMYPQFLSDGRRFVFVRRGAETVEGLYSASLDSPKSGARILPTQYKVLFAPPKDEHPAYLLWMRDQALMAQRFDEGNLRVEGDPVPVVQDVEAGSMRASYWASPSGHLVYQQDSSRGRTRMNWIDSAGKREFAGSEGQHAGLRLSPDGTKVAFVRREGASQDIWVHDFARSATERFTFDSAPESDPVWSPDGRFLAYRVGTKVVKRDVTGDGPEQQVGDSGGGPLDDWSPDGRFLLFGKRTADRAADFWLLPLQPGEKPRDWLSRPETQAEGSFSRDGKWVAYVSTQAGPMIFARAWNGGEPAAGGQWQVATGASHPRWRADGKELFYQENGKIMVTPVRSAGRELESGPAREFVASSVSPSFGQWNYDVAPAGNRVIAFERAGPDSVARLNVIVNWQALLGR